MNVCDTEKRMNTSKIKKDFKMLLKVLGIGILVIIGYVMIIAFFHYGLLAAKEIEINNLSTVDILLFKNLIGSETIIFGFSFYALNISIVLLYLVLFSMVILFINLIRNNVKKEDMKSFIKNSLTYIFVLITVILGYFAIANLFLKGIFVKLSEMTGLNIELMSIIGIISAIGYILLAGIKSKKIICKRYF